MTHLDKPLPFLWPSRSRAGRQPHAASLDRSVADGATAATTLSAAANKIVTENQKAGTPQSTWAIHGSIANQGDTQIEGFATQISSNAGQTVSFKVKTASSGYKLDVYRLGYYGGNGARLVASVHHAGAANQPSPVFNSATRTVDAGNWSVTDAWAVPGSAVSGVYVAKLTTDSGNYQNLIPFVVRNDATPSDILFQTSDSTWQAYNPWGGYNLYEGPNGRSNRASAVSYNRPIVMNATTLEAGPQDFLFGEEFAAISWLERNGFDVSYISGIDAATKPGSLLNAKAYIDVGHDEYWTQSQFANVKAAAAAGVNEAFLSGNQTYWDTELAPSFDASHTPNRTVVEYKDIWSGRQLDPNGTANGGAGLFRDPVYGPGTPENALSGTIFTVDDIGTLDAIAIPASKSQFRFWRNTSIASGNGGTLANLLGYEWDSDLDNGARPGGLIDMSSTTRTVDTLLLDNGLTTGPGTATHSLTLFRNPTSGALVFGAGTVMWSWGLSSQHATYRGLTAPVSPAVQQAMVNLFADMGIQPQTLQSGLVAAQASTDHTAPTAVIAGPGTGSSFNPGQTVTITGTASDAGGGRVAGIEVSTDGGSTWHPASGTTSWTYSWQAEGAGTHVIKARATDDSANRQATPAARSISVKTLSGTSLFSASATPAQSALNDGKPIELGLKFKASVAGQITALRFYRSAADTGPDVLDLWTAGGTKLASATFGNTTSSGWQTVTLKTPVPIAANTTYVTSYHTMGAYVATNDGLASAVVNGSLTAPSSGASGGNGVYAYGGTATAGTFPTNAFSASNYFADVVFSPSTGTTNQAPTATADSGFTTAVGKALSIDAARLLANDTDPNSDTLVVTGVGSPSHGTVAYNATSKVVTFTPASGYSGPAAFTYAISDNRGGTASANVAVSVGTPATESFFAASAVPARTVVADPNPVELGLRFSTDVAGSITAIKFYKGSGNTGTHTASLWSSGGTRLATATFTNETAGGWQTATFATPVPISANTTYVASYHSAGNYSATGGFFASSLAEGDLNAPAGANGVYAYGATSAFPTSSFNSTNYYVDVAFRPQLAGA